MIEVDRPDELPAKKRRVSRLEFYGTVLLATLALTGLWILLLLRIGLPEIPPPFRVLLIVPPLCAFEMCRRAAGRFLKRLGLSRESMLVEDVTRPPGPAPSRDAVGEIVAIPLNFRGYLDNSETVLTLVLITMAIVLINDNKSLVPLAIMVPSVFILFALLTAIHYTIWGRRWTIRVDEFGVTGPPSKEQGKAKVRHAPWDRIGSCTIQTNRDPTGWITFEGPVLKDDMGAEFLRLNLRSIPKPERDRLLEAIRIRFPGTRLAPITSAPARGESVGPVADERGVIESPSAVILFTALSWVFSGVAILILVTLWGAYTFLSPARLSPQLWGEAAGFLVAAAFAVLIAVSCRMHRREWLVQIDDAGITGPSMGSIFRRAFVPWKSIASCEVVTAVDLAGETVPLLRILKDAKGATLLEIDLRKTPRSTRKRLAESLRERLPKTDIDPWDELA
jgi:hypothetical protein